MARLCVQKVMNHDYSVESLVMQSCVLHSPLWEEQIGKKNIASPCVSAGVYVRSRTKKGTGNTPEHSQEISTGEDFVQVTIKPLYGISFRKFQLFV